MRNLFLKKDLAKIYTGIKGDALNIDKNEVLRYLGYRNQEIDEDLDKLIDQCIKEVKDSSKPKYIYKVFDLARGEASLGLQGANLVLQGEDIKEHLKHSERCALLAVTLGVQVEQKIKYYNRINLTKAVIMDSCATAYVEELADQAEWEIKKEAESQGCGITFRFSPGYGDLPIEMQGTFLNLLDAGRRIGLVATETSILTPRKSVTAIIGFQKSGVESKARTCEVCSKYDECNFRKGGGVCGS